MTTHINSHPRPRFPLLLGVLPLMPSLFGYGPALAAADEAVLAARQQGFSLAQTDPSHQLQLHFFAAHGSIASLTAHHALVAQNLPDPAGPPLFSSLTPADYHAGSFTHLPAPETVLHTLSPLLL